ncbi:gp53-like domain-containing protein [Candidatus Pantoea deserta]|uniref:gp53-like domain-containing protein n=1 Tax=Candidatus Pantoea deserta TaxID=1869313 RepID=UPI001F18DEB1|nr:hypothetical protein [Pantoea deserta]
MPAGTITLTNNSATVTGSGTSFTSELKANDFIVAVVGGVTYTLGVKSVDSATGVTLITAYSGPTTSGLAWTAVPNAALVGITAQVAADVAKAIRGLNLDKANWQQVYSASGNITVTLPDGTQYSGPAWNSITNTLGTKLDKSGGTLTGPLNGTTLVLSSSGTMSSMELVNDTPFIDFHYGSNASVDYTTRIIESASGTLTLRASSSSYAGLAVGALGLNGQLTANGNTLAGIGALSFNSVANLRTTLGNMGFSQGANNSFDIPGPSRTMRIMCSTAVVTTNTSGETTVTYPQAFSTALVGLVICAGDNVGNPFAIINYSSSRTSSFDFHCANASSSVRVNYIAIGY